MSNESKTTRLDAFIRRQAETVAAGIIAEAELGDVATLRKVRAVFTSRMAYAIAHDPYRMMELQDIMEWRPRPENGRRGRRKPKATKPPEAA